MDGHPCVVCTDHRNDLPQQLSPRTCSELPCLPQGTRGSDLQFSDNISVTSERVLIVNTRIRNMLHGRMHHDLVPVNLLTS